MGSLLTGPSDFCFWTLPRFVGLQRAAESLLETFPNSKETSATRWNAADRKLIYNFKTILAKGNLLAKGASNMPPGPCPCTSQSRAPPPSPILLAPLAVWLPIRPSLWRPVRSGRSAQLILKT